MKLISMREFVLEQENKLEPSESMVEFYQREITILKNIRDYAKFLSQPLTLGMFVPVGDDGNVLEEPFASDEDAGSEKEIDQIAYNKSEERVLFKGFKWGGEHICYSDFWADYLFVDKLTVEDLLNQLPKNEMPALTQQAIKQLGL